MTVQPLEAEIGRPGANLDAIASTVVARPELLPAVLAGLGAEPARVKFGCLKILRLASARSPAVLYPHFDRLVELLDSDNSILRWGGIIILGNLAAIDSDHRLEALMPRYLQPISGPVMITAANTIAGAAKIALAQPRLLNPILGAILRVEQARYKTPECRNVAIGHALKALGLLFQRVPPPARVTAFARRQLRNRRHAVQRTARAFLKRHSDRSTVRL